MDAINAFDISVFSVLNNWHSPYFDSLMWLISGKLAWIPLIIAILFLAARKGWRQLVVAVLAVALTIVVADQISSSLIKPLVQRLRPSHNPDLADTIHLVREYTGGLYGFVSSHAANAFGVATIVSLLFRNRITTWTFILWAVIVCYSRIYEGVHYPGDIICGAIVGAFAALLIFLLYTYFSRKTEITVSFSREDSRIVSVAMLANIILLAALA